MKRLTDKRLALPPGVWQEVTREQRMGLQEIPVPSKQELYYRLFQIEEILCDGEDDYDLDRLSALCNQRMTMREEVSERFSLTAKIPLDRLREIAEAEREGRYVVLPCKVGDVVYEIRYTAENIKPRKHAKKKFDHSVSGCTWRMRACPDMCYVSEKKCTKSDFSFMGRTVFLTRAEAEKALKARERDG